MSIQVLHGLHCPGTDIVTYGKSPVGKQDYRCRDQRALKKGQVLAYVFGGCKDEAFLKLKALLEPFGITKYDTDGWGAYGVTSTQRDIELARTKHKKSRASISIFGHASSAWCAVRAAFPRRNAYDAYRK
jgi:IS1 family transposase